MRLYAETKNELPINTDIMCAIEGAQILGWEIHTFTQNLAPAIANKAKRGNAVCVGSINTMKQIFACMDATPEDLDFPAHVLVQSQRFLGRGIMRMKVREAIEIYKRTQQSRFVKPVETKLFDAMELHENCESYFKDFLDAEAYVSNYIPMDSEWRAYVFHGKLMDLRNYAGDFTKLPDIKFISENIMLFENAPVAYTIDVAISEGKTVVVEYGDFWGVGSYGMDPQNYADMLIERFKQIKHTHIKQTAE